MFLVRKLLVSPSIKVTPIIFIDPEGSKRYDTHECPICLDKLNKFNKAKMPCGHYFHTDCILDWVDKCKNCKMSCPVCRLNLTWTLIKSRSE